MDSIWLGVCLILAVAAIVQAGLLALQAWEHRRYSRSCMRDIVKHHPTGRVLVLAPCKGFSSDLEDNLRAVMTQDYTDYEVTFIVESKEDAACPVIERVTAEHFNVAARILVAGVATDSGQKVHNLRAATAKIPRGVEYLVFVDSDGRPCREWLRMAISRLGEPGTGATTGYRWMIPMDSSLASHLISSINCNIMSLLGRNSHYLLWGGSWAIRRETFDRIGLHQAWHGTLSDDLVASREMRRAKLRVRFEPACVVAAPVEQSLGSMFSFLRRQYVIGKFYSPGWWLFAMAVAPLRHVAWLALLLVLVCGTGITASWTAATVLATLYGLDIFRNWLMQDLAGVYFPERYAAMRVWRWFHVLGGPIVTAAHWFGLLSSAFGRQITWRRIRYQLAFGGGIVSQQHLDETPVVYDLNAECVENDSMQRAA